MRNVNRRCLFVTLYFIVAASLAGGICPSAAFAQEYGTTEFHNSGAEAAQEPFLEGLLMLHSFEYEDARHAFQQAQQIDTGFVMAYWGEAMTYNHPVWFSQNRAAAVAALEKLGATAEERLSLAETSRERHYLRAAHVLFGEGDKEARDDAYAEEMAKLAEQYPEDLDAAALHALSILGTSHEGRDFATYMQAAAVAEEVFTENPRHPGAAHYLIHSYDDPVHAPLGLRPARVYADIAPSAAHAQHMPSHIFIALGLWDDVVRSNEESWAASEQRVAQNDLGVDARGFHALLWLTYGYLQQGRYDDAEDLLRIMDESHQEAASGRTAYHLASMRAAYLVETEEWMSRAAEINVDLSVLSLEAAATELFARGFTSIGRGATDDAAAALEAIRSLDESASDDNAAARARAMAYQLDALITHDQGNAEGAIERIRAAVELEDTLPLDYGPPSPVKPSNELLGDMLLREGRAEEAAEAYRRALDLAPRRAKALSGLARAVESLGRHDEAAEISAELADVRMRGDGRSDAGN